MKETIFITLMLFTSLSFSQKVEIENDFRQLKGRLLDESGRPFLGQNIMIKGSKIGTQTDFDGYFCLAIPKNKIVYLELLFCFEQIIREIKPSEKYVEMKIGKGKSKSKKANKKWMQNKDSIVNELNEVYDNISYEQVIEVICR